MIIDSPIVSGSQLASGPLTQIGNVQITGSLSVTGPINGSITGSVTSASYATSAEFLDGLDSTSFVFTSSFETYSGSVSTREANLEATASTLTTASASFAVVSSSFATTSGSLSTRVTDVEATASINTQASASFAAQSASLSTRLTTDEANITTLTSASSSFAAQSASLSTRITEDETNFTNLSSSFAITSGSLSTRVTNLESTSSTVSSSFATTSGSIAGRVTLIEGQYATTGSNVFTGPQFINQASNAIGFTSTASIYTDGGLRVTKDFYVSGTSYFNNVVVYGTSSIQYITSSQLNIGTNIITVNTDTPAVRFGGLAVFDSGSTQLTGSMLWDSERNHWVYSNPSGSSYSGGMLMSGPRSSALGSEQGTTSCAVMIGQGGDHITSSAIYSYGNATCFYEQSFISASGDACFAGAVCAPSFISTGTVCSSGNTCFGGMSVVASCLGIGTATPAAILHVSQPSANTVFRLGNNTTYDQFIYFNGNSDWSLGMDYSNSNALAFSNSSTLGTNDRMVITTGGAVGIGTTTPNALLHVSSVDFDDTYVKIEQRRGGYASSLNLIGATDDGAKYNRIMSQTCGGTNHWQIGGGGVASTMVFLTGNVERMRITSAGLVQINNVCTAKGNLDVSSDVNAVPLVIRGRSADGEGQVEFWNYTGTTRYGVLGSTSNYTYFGSIANTRLFFQTNSTERLSISNTGIACFACQVCAPTAIFSSAVGICTPAPATKLALNSYTGARLPYINGTNNTFDANGITVGNSNNGNTNIGGGIDFTNNCYCINAYSPILSFSSVTSNYTFNNAYAGIWGVLQGQGVDANWVKGDLVLGTGAGAGITERMRILSTGQVIIGATNSSLTRNASVVGTTGFSVQNDNNSGTYFDIIPNAANSTVDLKAYQLTGANPPMTFYTGNAERMRITNDGGVLIGRTSQAYSPSTQGYMLSVGSCVTQAVIAVAASGQTLGSCGVLYGLDGTRSFIVVRENLPLGFDTNNTERMKITTGGQVQVGCGVNSMFYNGAGCRYNFTNLNTPQDLVGICANNGIIVIRDHTAGGTGVFLIDPNQGVICMASNIPATVSIAWSGSVWRWCLTSGGVPRCLGYGFYGA